MTDVETTELATRALLESGAVMLGAALLFVMLFRKLRLGATLGYIVGGALIGPQLLGLFDDPEDLSSFTRADCGDCARIFSGSGWRRCCCAGSRSACSFSPRLA